MRKFKLYMPDKGWSNSMTLWRVTKETDISEKELDKIISLKPGCTLKLDPFLTIRRERK